MQKVLTKYWLTVHVGFLLLISCLIPFLYAGKLLTPLLWLSAVTIEAAMLLPSVRYGETLADARERERVALVKDPLFYLGFLFLVYTCLQGINSGCRLTYLSDADVWQFTSPALDWAPFGVDGVAAWNQFSIWTVCVVGCLCLRHAMSQSCKRYLLQWAVVLCGLLSVLAIVCFYFPERTGSSFCFPLKNGGTWMGTFSGFWLLVGMGVLAEALSNQRRGVRALFLFGVVGNLMGMLVFSDLWSFLLYSVLFLVIFLYWMVYLRSCTPKFTQFKLFVVSILVPVLIGLGVSMMKTNSIVPKVVAVASIGEQWRPLMATKEIRTTAALKIWQEHPWVGVGPDGYRSFVGSVVSDKDWRTFKKDSDLVYNDSVQLLCEYGLLGVGVMAAFVVTLLVPLCYRIRLSWLHSDPTALNGERSFMFRLSPLVVTGTLAVVVCVFESCLKSPFRSSSVLVSWLLVLSLLPAFLPRNVVPAA
jgi:hypothetical protein